MTNENEETIKLLMELRICKDDCSVCKLRHLDGDTHCHHEKALNLAIKALEQARPKGKWSRPSVVAMPYSFAYECPICRQWGNIQTFEPNYCPNCGADMRGEGDE